MFQQSNPTHRIYYIITHTPLQKLKKIMVISICRGWSPSSEGAPSPEGETIIWYLVCSARSGLFSFHSSLMIGDARSSDSSCHHCQHRRRISCWTVGRECSSTSIPRKRKKWNQEDKKLTNLILPPTYLYEIGKKRRKVKFRATLVDPPTHKLKFFTFFAFIYWITALRATRIRFPVGKNFDNLQFCCLLV